jgi:SAM-dependent methyltransferase
MTDNTKTNSEEDFDWFKQNGIFMPMINDTYRNIRYKQAIEQAVPGKVVCDIGTGTGLLSILAAKAGATKVYSVEMDAGRAAFARNIIKQIGLDDVIEVVNENFYKTDITADVYISETIGSQLFNEYIIDIAEYALRHGGIFLPNSFDIWLEMYDDHPIFPLVTADSGAFEFQPDIEIDPKFESLINQGFQKQHPLDSTLYRASTINGLFTMLPQFTDLKLTKVYETKPLHIDLSQTIDQNNIRLTIPADCITDNNTKVVVLFWTANMFGDVWMPVKETWWGNPIKTILPHIKQPNTDIAMWYDRKICNWRLSY